MQSYLSKGIIIEQVKRNAPFKMQQPHSHSSFELYFLAELDGTAEITINEQTYSLEKHNLVLIDSQIKHQTDFSAAKSHERFLIEIRPDFLTREANALIQFPIDFFFSQHTGVHQVDRATLQNVLPILKSIYNETMFHEQYYEDIARLKILEVILLLNRFFEDQSLQNAKLRTQQKETIQPVVQYLVEHLEQPLSLQSLAEHFFLNKSYLARAFKAYTGQTVHAFLNQKRIEQAQRLLLLHLDYSTDEVAGMTGFTSTAYFSRIFKKISGLSPRAFRQQYASSSVL